MADKKVYTESEVRSMLHKTVDAMLDGYLDNGIAGDPQEETRMSDRIKQRAVINGKTFWITGYSSQDVLDRYLDLCYKEGVATPSFEQSDEVPLFGEYLDTFVRTYKQGQQSLTAVNRDRIIRNHIAPKFGEVPVNKITVPMIQKWLNELAETYAKETILKIVHTMNPALDAAVEDGYLTCNPLRSPRIKIGGKDTVGHKAIPSFKMEAVRNGLRFLNDRERKMAALLSYTGMRFEEVLGLRWEDIDFERGWISIRRAVVHPKRNLPEVKCPKTKTSERDIPIPSTLKADLGRIETNGFVLRNSKGTPLSYTEARRSFDKIRKEFGLDGYSAHDFRDTCATEWREKGIPLDVIARMLGHAKTETTEKKYVTYRDTIYSSLRKALEPSKEPIV